MYRSVTNPEDPFLIGMGPAEFSTVTALQPWPTVIHDCNGYYRALGVSPQATRRDLRVAYYERGGQDSEYLTYVLKQLLDPQVRSLYDGLQLGEQLVDKYVQARLRAFAERKHSEMMRRLRDAGQAVTSEVDQSARDQIWSNLGLHEDSPERGIASDGEVGQDGRSRPAKVFPYRYYLWRIHLRQGDPHLSSVLSKWQECLVSAFARQGVSIRLSVGVHGHMAYPWILARVGYREVIFLHHLETPTPALAEDAVSRWVQENHHVESKREILL